MKIIILAGKGQSTSFVYNALRHVFTIEHIVLEDNVSRRKLLRRRLKKLGYVKVLNQLLFQLTIPACLAFFSKRRINEVKNAYHMSSIFNPECGISNVLSVNEQKCIDLLKALKPDIILVNGTRIISKNVLDSTNALFINTHVGITPQYRGVHGAYWALASGDKDNCGVTIHKVDKGVDTGDIIKQATIDVTSKDNFATYPLIQYGVAIELLKSVLTDISEGKMETYKKRDVKSNLYYHPTFTEYLLNFLLKGVK